MAQIEVAVNNVNVAIDAMHRQISLGLSAIGETMEGYAKEGTPVDTGRLRNDITYQVVDTESEEYEVQVGTNVEYAVYQEFGEDYRHKTGGPHFLRNSVTDHTTEYEKILEAALKS